MVEHANCCNIFVFTFIFYSCKVFVIYRSFVYVSNPWHGPHERSMNCTTSNAIIL